jgi:hypothetical protein
MERMTSCLVVGKSRTDHSERAVSRVHGPDEMYVRWDVEPFVPVSTLDMRTAVFRTMMLLSSAIT